MRLDHVQVSCPPGGEDLARAFYGEALGMTEVEKPELLKARGGCWFKDGTAEIHVGVEEGFTPAKKAHPALAVDDLDGLAAKLADLGYRVTWDNDTIPGRRRFHTADGHGNRVEIVRERAQRVNQ